MSSRAHSWQPPCHARRVDDPLVAGAATQVARERLADLVFGRAWVVAQVGRHRHDKPWRAEAALEPMSLAEGFLHRVEATVGGRQALDGGDLGAIRLDREQEARAHCIAVEADGARPTHAV